MSWLTDPGAAHWLLAASWLPHLSLEMQAVLRMSYAVLLIGTIGHALPHARRFFLSERWGGYGESSPSVDAIQNPVVCPLTLAAWTGAAALLAAGVATPWTALATVVISRYFFIQMRWRGALRGMGAPGFVTYWLGAAVFVLEWTRAYAPAVQPLAVLVLQVDLGVIMLVAGIYKLTAGYASNEGMELGLANPEWGRWWRWYSSMRPGHIGLKLLNHLAWSTEVAIGVLAVVPPARPLAGVLLFTTFGFIATQIRLSLLCPTMMAAALLWVPEASWLDTTVSSRVPSGLVLAPAATPAGAPAGALALALLGYLALLPAAYGGLLFNFYGRRRLPALLQRPLDLCTNAFGMILWRVFSADVTNFYVVVHQAFGDNARRPRLISAYPGIGGAAAASGRTRRRFAHVGESIAITSIFTTLKYYPGDRPRFEDRLLRYARTIRCQPDAVLAFDYVSLAKAHDRFRHQPVRRFLVDAARQTVVETTLAPAVDIAAPARHSPVFAGARPGSYAPLAS